MGGDVTEKDDVVVEFDYQGTEDDFNNNKYVLTFFLPITLIGLHCAENLLMMRAGTRSSRTLPMLPVSTSMISFP